MKSSIIVLVVLAIASPILAAPIQWKVEDGGNGHWYEAVLADQPVGYVGQWDYSGGVTWTDARDAAVAKGGWLVDIASEAENTFAFNLVNPSQHPGFWVTEQVWTSCEIGPWIGGHQPTGSPEPGGNWQWVTGNHFMDASGAPTQYTNWFPTQPGNVYQQLGIGPPEDALHYYYRTPSSPTPTWNDYPSWSVTNGYVVEYENEPDLPEVATYNARADFSGEANPNDAWTYGWSYELGGSITAYPDYTPSPYGELGWHDEGLYPNSGIPHVTQVDETAFGWEVAPDQLLFHPGAKTGPEGEFSIIRWTAPEDGEVELDGRFAGAHWGNKNVFIYYNDQELFAANLPGYAVANPYDDTFSVLAGDTIDFAVGAVANPGGTTTAVAAIIDFTATPPVPGDFLEDGVVDQVDLTLLLSSWGSTERHAGWTGDWDGLVDQNELTDLLSNWGYGTETAEVPEPSSIILVSLGALSLLAFARRRK